jgi:hypothetical protein
MRQANDRKQGCLRLLNPLLWARVGDGNTYHEKVNKSLKLLNIFFTKNFQSYNFVQKIKALYV